MQGRKEHELKMMNKINNLINGRPSYIREYYNTIYKKSYTTQHVYLRYVLNFIDYLKDELNYDIDDVECFKKVKASTVNSYMRSLEGVGEGIKASRLFGIKSFFKYLENDRIVDYNPCDKVEVPKDNKENDVTYLTKKEIKTVLRNIKNGCGNELAKSRQKKWRSRDTAIFMLGFSLGLRVTSLTEINLHDIDFENNELTIVEKGNKTRTIMFSEKLKPVFDTWIYDRNDMLRKKEVDTDALFISRNMKRITADAIADLVKKYTYNIDKHISPHKLRSTCATNTYNATGDIYLTAEKLGHRNIANTKRYVTASKERKEKAAKATDNVLF